MHLIFGQYTITLTGASTVICYTSLWLNAEGFYLLLYLTKLRTLCFRTLNWTSVVLSLDSA